MNFIYQVIIYIFLVYIFLILFLNSIKKTKNNSNNENKSFHYYCLVPCVNEERVIRKTLCTLLNLDSECKVIPIDDGSTDKTLSIMKKFAGERCLIVQRVCPNAQKGKGAALNQALKRCIEDVKKERYNMEDVIVAVIDADGELSSNSLLEMNKIFSDPEVVAAQLRVKMYPKFRRILQVTQDFEFFTVNNLTQNARMKTRSVGLSGNGQFFRLGPIINNIGYTPWGTSLLDDYELTVKIMMKGLHIAYVSNAYVYQEALTSISRYIKQRSRWVQGNLDCLRYAKNVWKSSTLNFIQKSSIFYFLSQPFLNLIADICIIIFFVNFVRAFRLSEYIKIFSDNTDRIIIYLIIALILSVSWGGLFTFIYYLDLKKHIERKPRIYHLILLPIVSSYMYIILFFSVVIAFWRQLSNQHSWIKTKRN